MKICARKVPCRTSTESLLSASSEDTSSNSSQPTSQPASQQASKQSVLHHLADVDRWQISRLFTRRPRNRCRICRVVAEHATVSRHTPDRGSPAAVHDNASTLKLLKLLQNFPLREFRAALRAQQLEERHHLFCFLLVFAKYMYIYIYTFQLLFNLYSTNLI